MAIDDYFTNPGTVPFKWEIKPGVPKVEDRRQQQHHQKLTPPPPPPSDQPPVQPFSHQNSSELPPPKLKLKPPPAESYSYLFSPVEPRSRSFRSNTRSRADSWRFDRPLLARTERVSTDCFFLPLLRRMPSKRFIRKTLLEPGRDYTPDFDTLARWSLSSRKSLPSLRDSPPPSSVSSDQSSPRPVGDAHWAAFGLF